jgi:hypothetical protein
MSHHKLMVETGFQVASQGQQARQASWSSHELDEQSWKNVSLEGFEKRG